MSEIEKQLKGWECWHNRLTMHLTIDDDRVATENAVRKLISNQKELLDALQQCLTDIEGDEYTHNRNFAAGNVARDAIELVTGTRPKDVVG